MILSRMGTASILTVVCALLLLALPVPPAGAFETWSENPDDDIGNCADCHGKFGFAEENYVSAHDGTVWDADLMTGHGWATLTGCMECHVVEGDQAPIARCAGCHGRKEDAETGQEGAGLVQHHILAGITDCEMCHVTGEKLVGENVVPETMAAKGIDPCNDAQYGPDGLDNDGDGLYDSADPDCQKNTDTGDAAGE